MLSTAGIIKDQIIDQHQTLMATQNPFHYDLWTILISPVFYIILKQNSITGGLYYYIGVAVV